MAREKNLSNRVFSLGANRDAHKKLEKAAKEKRQKNKGGNEKKNDHAENKAKDVNRKRPRILQNTANNI